MLIGQMVQSVRRSPKTFSYPLPESPLQKIIENLHKSLKANREGKVATYIPELGKANPDWLAICLVTADGRVYEVGDTAQTFTIQSISKPFVYGIALEDNGKAEVLKKIWMEPSGEAFNHISLRPGTGQPANPMINAGAIATTSLTEGKTTEQKIHRIVDALGRYAGRNLTIDQSVYQSESSTGHRNRAIGHMLRNFDIIGEDPHASLEAYFMQCSISITCRDLGVMAATLANGGINPVTGVRAVIGDYVENILSVMGSCGMYDAAGEWIYNVGMPAKSGVAGGILAVLPGQLGIGVFSPLLDARGNSVRGIEACREISRKFNLHMFHVPRLANSVLRRTSDLANTRSIRLRSTKESTALRSAGPSVRILELQGELVFGTAEVAVREFSNATEGVKAMILDFAHVTSLNFSACELIVLALKAWLKTGRRVSLSRTSPFPKLAKALRQSFGPTSRSVRIYEDMDAALEAAENKLLEELKLRKPSSVRVTLKECELLQGVDRKSLVALEKKLKPVTFPEGHIVIQTGEGAGGMYFLMRGKASVWLKTAMGRERRVATFSPGMTFGEIALLDRSARSAEIRADSRIEALELSQENFQAAIAADPALHVILLRNLSLMLARRLRETNTELSKAQA
jgi:glutaminase